LLCGSQCNRLGIREKTVRSSTPASLSGQYLLEVYSFDHTVGLKAEAYKKNRRNCFLRLVIGYTGSLPKFSQLGLGAPGFRAAGNGLPLGRALDELGRVEVDEREQLGDGAVVAELAVAVVAPAHDATAFALARENGMPIIVFSIRTPGAIEAVVSLLTIQHQRIPPTINYNTPDPAIVLDVVGNKARDAKVRTVLSNSFGFGGTNGTVIFKRV